VREAFPSTSRNRLSFNGTIIETGTQSCLLARTKAAQAPG